MHGIFLLTTDLGHGFVTSHQYQADALWSDELKYTLNAARLQFQSEALWCLPNAMDRSHIRTYLRSHRLRLELNAPVGHVDFKAGNGI